ncbi:MAG: serine--tRNA ligase [Candidatus Taylorbacteria bacterium RIFCSPLOWO2_12_FULL_43_20]|uniref:Serine--tRNA ligase n=1 Tax=Candidatus Taylorbacteria bacterium RIFCSPLOWO2_12_FULL_43_20 TaxID=1802332 RepID=A0A1G2P246_9BACT|nr:MAG: serine--tRNA ligase [Candidatus Taylorbacteria bacterium RIFCSPHIGHO2_01_FULL_43_120]OHA23407.1 MAG: serine--tRNA ligase [Candidatus Taylorbacteria bacterium RIFCSPHIGHO2_02_FULL_43_55]OHA29539.1 MAG: serine--tRNA ligase [Candidatus Taylorbacteria bacterium RIFCSPHIGHO2_12_FULL_42_34]OHA31343.1 MAG: serine--tRNA ligase [Candidatus Taylorbacteria bacterium RIFCSPLOWO2_01_FULL_43_83]OHA38863.1 MAG: serine--tRNA ligase [Candidatus Taylorbacteria bacterium RIFCSPLOWO2_02_FULL_43_22b]OHA423
MLDIKFIRENKEIIKEGARKKQIIVDIDALIKLDDTRRELNMAIDQKRSEQNTFNDHITKVTDESERKMLIEKMKYLKDALQKDEEKMKAVMLKWKAMMLEVPNIPDMSVPEGVDESSNETALEWGNKPEFSFKPKDHVDLMVNLKMVDFERGAKAHGFRGYYLSGDGAELSWALWNYGRDFFGKKNFTPFIPPVIVRKEFFYGTGHLPRESEDLYKTGDDDYLSGTAEVPMMAYHSGEVLNENDLPRRYLAFSPCFRREAGSYGKDTKGLLRVHEFFKLEQLIISKADHADSVELHEEINRNYEEFIESLGLPYRRLVICGGDLGASKVKQYDTEAWFPAQGVYRELSSASYYHDFQTRRFNIRYDSGGKKRYAYSLNSTAVATPRIIGAIVENFQTEDGSVNIPEALRKYMGGREIIVDTA